MQADGTLQPFGRGRLARVALLGALGLLALLALPTAAPAERGLVTGFQADEYASPDPAERALWGDRTVASGAGIVRLTVSWGDVGPQRPPDPTNPGSASYDFSWIDRAVRDLAARGLTVLLNPGPGTPAWAEEPGRPASFPEGRWKPRNPADFADFVQAVAARYSGGFDPDGGGPAAPLPHVQALEIWNEENGEPWMSPQYGGTPDYYRTMLNLSYGAVKAVSPQTLVVVGANMPYGDPPGGPYPASGGRVRPVDFWQRVLCVHPVTVTVTANVKKLKKALSKAKKTGNRAKIKKLQKKLKKAKKKTTVGAENLVRTEGCPAPALFDVFAHHPLDNTGGGPHKSGPHSNDVSTPDLGRLVRVLRAAEDVGTTLPGRHPVWVTEFWWDSNPPNPVGASLDVQARWIEESFYLFWKAGASVAINFMIRDTNIRPDVHAGYQAGIFFADGTPKPSFTAFRFPFVTERINKETLQAWGKAPEGGTLRIERQEGAAWVTIKELQVGKGEVFLTELRSSGPFPASALRATVGASQSLVWQQSDETQEPTCKGKLATIVGTEGNDVRRGTSGKDVIVGLGGNDKVSGLAGNDLMCGGSGKDKLKGSKGHDKLYGEAGKDTLKGGPGKDKLKGGAGKDKQVQ